MTAFAGTPALVRLGLRRDRVRLPVWIAAITASAAYYAAALDVAYPTIDELRAVVTFIQGPAGTLLTGPGYGLSDPSYPSVFAAVYGLYVLLAVAFMNVLLVVRHTRGDEESGRTELVRAGAVGALAPLAAVTVIAVAADVLLGLLVAVVLANGFPAGGAILFGASVTALGLAFAGVAAVIAQLTEHARAATGMASACVGAALVIRGAGDALAEHGSALSWFSPFAWAQQTRVFVDDRAWPLLLCLALAVLSIATAATLQARRDVGAGLLSSRPGRGEASAALSGPWTLALRLERSSLIAWTAGLTAAGVLYGALAESVQVSFADLPEDLLAILGGSSGRLLDGFLSVMAFFNATLASCYGIAAVHRLTSEEQSGRAELVLSTAVSRTTWMGAAIVAALVGALVQLFASGLGMALAVAAVLGDASRVLDIVAAHLLFLPAVAVVIAVAGLGFAVRPRWANAAWVLAGYAIFMGYFAPLFEPPRLALDLSPFEHVARMPLEEPRIAPLLGLLAVAAVVVGAGLVRFRRRDLTAST
ncbi:hypothetical protein D9V41_12925 [Aeromicrobium phragmitis]|uniref:ABC transporter permease n=1 Tax=Aeromicrobium phragmitis TaxID=2478914 RepID=A0A3L8PI49_9ACTN|nr:hypothetical protein [Aeromicrobium phragmitis]RLV54997.1 hypothetical protein D9V41_12925 [Aeromicrobium phragmitis]